MTTLVVRDEMIKHANELLLMTSEFNGEMENGDTILLFTATLTKALDAEIKVVNSQNGPYLDAVLFDYGAEVKNLDVVSRERLDGVFEFEYEGQTHAVSIIGTEQAFAELQPRMAAVLKLIRPLAEIVKEHGMEEFMLRIYPKHPRPCVWSFVLLEEAVNVPEDEIDQDGMMLNLEQVFEDAIPGVSFGYRLGLTWVNTLEELNAQIDQIKESVVAYNSAK